MVEWDDITRRLLIELERNSRISYVELAKLVGLSPPSVSERLKKLENAGIIESHRTMLSLPSMGLPVLAFVDLELSPEKGDEARALAEELPEVVECYQVTGNKDFIMKVAAASIKHLGTVLERLSQLGRTYTSIVLDTPVTHKPVSRLIEVVERVN